MKLSKVQVEGSGICTVLRPEPGAYDGRPPHDEDDHHEHRHAEAHPRQQKARELQSAPAVGLGEEVVPAPAATADAERHEHERAERHDVARHQEVLDGLNVADAGDNRAREHVEAQRAGKRQQGNGNEVHRDGALARPAPLVHAKAQDGLEHGDDG